MKQMCLPILSSIAGYCLIHQFTGLLDSSAHDTRDQKQKKKSHLLFSCMCFRISDRCLNLCPVRCARLLHPNISVIGRSMMEKLQCWDSGDSVPS